MIKTNYNNVYNIYNLSWIDKIQFFLQIYFKWKNQIKNQFKN